MRAVSSAGVAATTLDGMRQDEIAWVAQWAAAHDGDHRLFATRDDTVLVGRDPSAQIRLGAGPVFDERVPRRWLELSWHRGAVIVRNHSRAGVDLAVYDADGETIVERQSVPAGFCGSPVAPDFTAMLDVPGGPGSPAVCRELRIRTSPSARPANVVQDGTDPIETVVPISLTAREKIVGRALIRPLLEGHPARASLHGLVHETGVARSTIQRTMSDLDVRFLFVGMAVPANGDHYDRVAYVLRRHRQLVR